MADRDRLSEMRSQADEAYAAADKLVREAEAAARERAGDVPPRGWEGARTAGERGAFADLQALVALLDSARTSVPPELAHQLADAARELLIAIRAMIDWWIERLEREPETPVEVQDIPIE